MGVEMSHVAEMALERRQGEGNLFEDDDIDDSHDHFSSRHRGHRNGADGSKDYDSNRIRQGSSASLDHVSVGSSLQDALVSNKDLGELDERAFELKQYYIGQLDASRSKYDKAYQELNAMRDPTFLAEFREEATRIERTKAIPSTKFLAIQDKFQDLTHTLKRERTRMQKIRETLRIYTDLIEKVSDFISRNVEVGILQRYVIEARNQCDGLSLTNPMDQLMTVTERVNAHISEAGSSMDILKEEMESIKQTEHQENAASSRQHDQDLKRFVKHLAYPDGIPDAPQAASSSSVDIVGTQNETADVDVRNARRITQDLESQNTSRSNRMHSSKYQSLLDQLPAVPSGFDESQATSAVEEDSTKTMYNSPSELAEEHLAEALLEDGVHM